MFIKKNSRLNKIKRNNADLDPDKVYVIAYREENEEGFDPFYKTVYRYLDLLLLASIIALRSTLTS